MDIKDVAYLGIMDNEKNIYYSMNYENMEPARILETIQADSDPIYALEDNLVLLHRQEEITVVVVGSKGTNEIFLYNAFYEFIEILGGLLKSWTVRRIGEKYDQIVGLANEFLYCGVILEDKSEKLKKKQAKRSFENMNAIPAKKGLAFLIHKATKSLKR